MRKIDDSKMMELLNEGKSQREVAHFFSVSEQAVSKRLKRLKSYGPPESFTRLTDKQKSFVLAKVEGKSNLEAVKSVYDVSTDESAKSMATVLMRDPDITIAIQDLLHQEGIGRRVRIRRLREVINCKDLSVASKGLEIANKLSGDYLGDKVNVSIDINAVVERADFLLRELRKEGEIKSEEVIEIKNGE